MVTGRSRWLLAAKLVFAVGIVGWLCTGPLDLALLRRVPSTFSLVTLGAILFTSLFLPAVRWWWLLRIQGIDASLWQATKLTWVGYVTALLLPGAASGDVAKSYLVLRDQPTARARSFSTVIVDRLIGVYSLILLGCLSAAWFLITHESTGSLRLLFLVMFALLVGSTIGVASVCFAPVRRLAARFVPAVWSEAWSESYRLYGEAKSALVGCLLLSLVSSALTALSLAAADRALGGDVGWESSLVVGPLVVLANCLPITPGGIGVAEAASSELFGQVGSSHGAEMMLAIRLVLAVLSLPALLLLFGSDGLRISTSPEMRPDAPGDVPDARAQRHAA